MMTSTACSRARLQLVLALAFCFPLAGAFAQTFVQRGQPNDLRVVSYNILWDSIFPSVDPVQAAKFERVVGALDADVWCLQEIGFNTPLNDVLNLLDGIAPLPGGAFWQGQKAGDCVIASKWPLSMKATATIPAGDKDLAMALVDLPDAVFGHDLYVMNNHYKCCGGNDNRRQDQSDAIINWMRDAREPGGFFNLPDGTPMMVVGDLNIVDGPQPLNTLIDGNIIDNSTYGSDSPPDWDGSDSLDAHPLHNVVGPDDWTWFTPGAFPPGRLDYVISTDSVLPQVHTYLLNTVIMSASELAANGLQPFDVTIDNQGLAFDHLPLVADFRGDVSPWTQLPGAIVGGNGLPLLEGAGSLQGGTPVSLTLSSALPNGLSSLVFGLSQISVPFRGGLLVPAPDVVISGLPLDGSGGLMISDTWPTGLPAGVAFYTQHWIVDPAAVQGLAASNGLEGVTP